MIQQIRKGRPLSDKSKCIIGALISGPKLCHEIAAAIGETDLHRLRQNLRDLWRMNLLDREAIPGKHAGKPILLYAIGTGKCSISQMSHEEAATLANRQRRQRRPVVEVVADDEPDESTVGPNGGRMVRFGKMVRPSDPGQMHDFLPRRTNSILGE